MNIPERNRLIKKVLKKEFENVKVVGSRGTAYGWVDITIYTPQMHEKHEYNGHRLCQRCVAEKIKIQRKVEEILENAGLMNEIYSYSDDMGFEQKEILIHVELEPVFDKAY